jgi:hypothetical protein
VDRALLDNLAPKDKLDKQVMMETLVGLVPKDPMVQQEQKGPMVLPARKVAKAPQAPSVRQVSLVKTV